MANSNILFLFFSHELGPVCAVKLKMNSCFIKLICMFFFGRSL